MATSKCRAKDPSRCPYHGTKTIEHFFGNMFLPTQPENKEDNEKVSNTVPEGSWSTPGSLLFKTLHGSGLYGLSHENSDRDFFTVTAPEPGFKKAQQVIEGGVDAVAMDFKTFVQKATKGSPQALEAMFSRTASYSAIDSYRAAFRASGSEVVETYQRTIKSFSLAEDSFKKNRHAFRLLLNLNDIIATGRFDPTLSKTQVEFVNRKASLSLPERKRELKAISYFEMDLESNLKQ